MSVLWKKERNWTVSFKYFFYSEWYKEVVAAAFSVRKPSLGKAIVRFAWIELMFVGLFGVLNVSC